jgi:2-C-methyl-D-erythritol 4-phosphate cytidylyltransferase/2-C-methyl-D-erythritol 2,4-cyclodiphosphate synthase
MSKQLHTIAIITAAGESLRFASDSPKQYLKIAGESLLTRSIKKFISHELVDAVIVVINEHHVDQYLTDTVGLKLLPYVIGGKRRQDSVRNALEAVATYAPTKVLIHDAARIFVDEAVITEVMKALDDSDGAIAATPVADTLKHATGGVIDKTVPRANMFAAQTPQGFRYELIRGLHNKYQSYDFTDDAQLLEQEGKQVKIVESSVANFKITHPDDLEFAQTILKGVPNKINP